MFSCSIRIILLIAVITVSSIPSVAQALVNVAGGAEIFMSDSTIININGSISFDSGSKLTMKDTSRINISGDWENSGMTFTTGNGKVVFKGDTNQHIKGSQSTAFHNIEVNKSGGNVILDIDTRVDNQLKLTASLLDLNQNVLTIDDDATILSPTGTTVFDFNSSYYILNSESGGNYTGQLVREITEGITSQVDLTFPVGTAGYYSPAKMQFIANKNTFDAGAHLSVSPVGNEHPDVQKNNVSLAKYWVVTTENVTQTMGSADVVFYYKSGEVRGNEGSYVVLEYLPPYPDTAGSWKESPGRSNNVMDFNNKFFYSNAVDNINGDWTAGEESAAKTIYYSRADGDYNNPATWSKEDFGGVVSTTYPSNRADRVLIKNNKVTINAAIEQVNLLEVKENATLEITGNYTVAGDTFRLEDNGALQIGHDNGITSTTSSPDDGFIQTTERILSENAVYEFIDSPSPTQKTGDGLPTIIRSIVVTKAAGTKVNLGSHVQITDSLVINEGTYDINIYSINGYSSGRTLTMRGGELIIPNTFPTNYTSPYFIAGKIIFDGTGNGTIPSSGSIPSVQQYYDLIIRGTRTGSITFRPTGQINISNNFDISELNFSGTPSQRFFTDNSTVVFNKNGGLQDVQCLPASPADTVVNLSYYNLILDSAGTKQLNSGGNPLFIVKNNLRIRNNADFAANGFNLELQGDWYNMAGTFDPANAAVIFRSPVALVTRTIFLRDTTDNPFYNVRIAGAGIVKPDIDMLVKGFLRIGSTSTFKLEDKELTLNGNWENLGGTFDYGTSKVYFTGSARQNLSKTSAVNEIFYDIEINNQNDVDANLCGLSSAYGVEVNNEIILTSGNLITRQRYLKLNGAISRPGANPGHIDGYLWKNVSAGVTSKLFEVGYAHEYTPVTIDFNDAGGTEGFLSVLSDTVTATTSPVSTGINPAGSEISDLYQVRRQWVIEEPSGSQFQLGINRTYDVTVNYISGDDPAGDYRNSTTWELFEARLWTGTEWLKPQSFGQPLMGARTDGSTEFRLLEQLGTVIVGEPSMLTYYSRQNGNWSDANTWSTQSYGGAASIIAPRTSAKVLIGDNDEVTLDVNYTAEGYVIVDSTGLLKLEDKVISGTGEFRIMDNGAVAVGNASGITSSGASGNIQTANRFYNYGYHGRSHFIYNGMLAQSSGNGIPDTLATLTIDKTADAVSLVKNILVGDSLHIKTGTLTGNADITLLGNMRRNNGGIFSPGTKIVRFSGDSAQYISNESTSLALEFYNLFINKADGKGKVIIGSNTPLIINNNLEFTATNYAIIDAAKNTGNYVTALNTVTRAGRGHINGELRKNIPAGNTSLITFEVGDTTFYTPYLVDFDNSGGTAGLVGVINIPGEHPEINNGSSPIDPARYIPRYWRLTRPSGSTFDRGARTLKITLRFIDPNDIQTIDHPTCIEMAYYTGNGNGWQPLRPNTVFGNFGLGCSDTRFITGGFSYSGSMTSVVLNNLTSSTALGSQNYLADGSLILGEFVTGNQNSGRTTIFYSRKDGNWADGTTWSTTSHNGTAANDYPTTQYDVAYIGAGHTVVLNENIGTNFLYSTVENDFYGPATNVKSDGIFDLNHHVLRGASFKAFKGATIKVGAADGITSTGEGNVLTLARTFEDSINVVYTASGYTPDFGSGDQYCRPSWNAGSKYMVKCEVLNSGGTTVMENNTNNTFKNQGYFYFADKSAPLQAGQQYRFRLSVNGGGQKRFRVWIDYDYSGSFNNTTELVVDETSPSGIVTTNPFTVPASVKNGATRIRVMMRATTDQQNACDSNLEGEIEDYTASLINTNTVVAQVTGNKMPSNLYSFRVHSKRNNGSTVELQKEIKVRDSVKITSGQMNASNNDIHLVGNFIHDTTNGFFANGSDVIFYNKGNGLIKGTADVNFGNVLLRKPDTTGKVTLYNKAIINGNLNFENANIFAIADNSELLIKPAGTITPGAGSYYNYRMVQSTGTLNAGKIVKEFTTDPGAKTFLFPVGTDTVYNSANISITGSYSGTPSYELILYKGLHPQRPSNDILNKYWNFNHNDISSVTANSLQFRYHTSDINGDVNKYLPALYQTGIGWEINVGTNPTARPSPINITNTAFLEGDWTAGDGFYNGRIFYSLYTGTWDIAGNWSNQGHDPLIHFPASYYPGQLGIKDTVLIDGHLITFNVDSAQVDSLNLGGTNPIAVTGELTMGATPANKALILRRMNIMEDAELSGNSVGNRIDTIHISEHLTNTSTGSISFANNANSYTALRFFGSGNSDISGEGNFQNISKYILDKTGGLSDTLKILSNSFSLASVNSAYTFYNPKSGVLNYNLNNDLSLSSDGQADVLMGQNSGLYIQQGNVRSSTSLNSNFNTSIKLDGGNLFAGNDSGENLLYTTGTTIDLITGKISVAGSFARRESASDINLTIRPAGEIFVLTEGNPNSSYIGFDINNSGSSFSMDGGRIVVADHNSGTLNDIILNGLNGTGMTGGILQIGDTTITPNATTINVAGIIPVYDIHCANSPGASVVTKVTEENYRVINDVTIDANHRLSMQGNNLYLGGDIINYGNYDAISGSSPTDPRLIVLNGSGDQSIFNDLNNAIEFFNTRINKSGGKVILGTGNNSNVVTRNTLEFTSGNQAIIDATLNDKYYELSPSGGSNPQVLRIGKGHIYGLHYRRVESGNQSVKYHVGSEDINGYRPATFASTGADNTAGLVGVKLHQVDHPDISNATVDMTSNIQLYWTVTANGFALGSGRFYDLTTQFLNPLDIRNNPNLNYFDHHVHTPPYPAAGTWKHPFNKSRTSTTVTSTGNNYWGDYVVGIYEGLIYYSVQNGPWTDINTWSITAYDVIDPPLTLPGFNDIVKIGNGKKVTLPEGVDPVVRSVYVEVFDGKPGALYMEGEFGYIQGSEFILEDECEIGLQHVNGIMPSGNLGAIQTINRMFGVAKYVYNADYGSQQSGRALPDSITAIVVDNTTGKPNNTCFISTYTGQNPISIRDSILVNSGKMNTGGCDINLYGNFKILNNTTDNEGEFNALTSHFYIAGIKTKEIVIGNNAGIPFYDLNVSGGNISVIGTTEASDTANIYVNNSFVLDGTIINTRTRNRKVIVLEGATMDRPTSRGYIDGTLGKPVGGGLSDILFEIGEGSNYTPARLMMSSGSGNSGVVEATNYVPVPNLPDNGPYSGNRLDQSKMLPRWWKLEPMNVFSFGNRTADALFMFPRNEMSNFDTTLAVIRRKSIPVEDPLWSQRNFPDLDWYSVADSGYVHIQSGGEEWPGIGEFYMGEKFQRIFYSLATGVWEDGNSWTFEPSHIGPPLDASVYPNNDPYEMDDKVELGLDHVITLNTDTISIEDLNIKHGSKLDMRTNVITNTSGLAPFAVIDSATIAFGGTNNTIGTVLNYNSYLLELFSTVEFNGDNQIINPDPFGLIYGNVRVTNNGIKYVNVPVLIRRNLIVDVNALLEVAAGVNSLQVQGSINNDAQINNLGIIEIGN